MKPEVETIVGALRYQVFAPRVTTWGACSQGCGRGARGAGICAECRTGELANIVGPLLAYRLLADFRAVVQTLDGIEAATTVDEAF